MGDAIRFDRVGTLRGCRAGSPPVSLSFSLVWCFPSVHSSVQTFDRPGRVCANELPGSCMFCCALCVLLRCPLRRRRRRRRQPRQEFSRVACSLSRATFCTHRYSSIIHRIRRHDCEGSRLDDLRSFGLRISRLQNATHNRSRAIVAQSRTLSPTTTTHVARLSTGASESKPPVSAIPRYRGYRRLQFRGEGTGTRNDQFFSSLVYLSRMFGVSPSMLCVLSLSGRVAPTSFRLIKPDQLRLSSSN